MIGFDSWSSMRPHDNMRKRDPYRQFFFICEGENTEEYYFEGLSERKENLGIDSLVDVVVWEKGDVTRGMTKPRCLLELAKSKKEESRRNGGPFREGRDRMVIVFDADNLEDSKKGYYERIIREIEDDGNIAAVTNPNFELFLILHFEDAYEMYIKGQEAKFLKKDEKGARKYSYHLFKQISGIDSKSNPDVGGYSEKVLIAIEQEKKINQDVHDIKGKVTSNIGAIIQTIIEDTPDR